MLKPWMWTIDNGKLLRDKEHAISYHEDESFKIPRSTASFSRWETSVNVLWEYLLNVDDDPRLRYRYFPSLDDAHEHYKAHEDSFPPLRVLRKVNYGGHERFVVDGLPIPYEAFVVDGATEGTWHFQLKRFGAYLIPYSESFDSPELAADAAGTKVSRLTNRPAPTITAQHSRVSPVET